MEELMLAALGCGLGFPCGSSEDDVEDQSELRDFSPHHIESEEEREERLKRERIKRRKAKRRKAAR
jgi:hypothetical protein